MFFDDDGSQPGHPVITVTGVTIGLFFHALLYLLCFSMVIGFVMLPVMLAFLAMNAVVDFEALGIGRVMMVVMLALSVLVTIALIEARVESLALGKNMPLAIGRVRQSFALYFGALDDAEVQARERFEEAESGALRDAVSSSSSHRRHAAMHRLHLGIAAIVPPGLAAYGLYWSLVGQGTPIEQVIVAVMFLCLPFMALWFLWMGWASEYGKKASLRARASSVGEDIARERAEAQAGALSISAPGASDGGISIAEGDGALTLSEDESGEGDAR